MKALMKWLEKKKLAHGHASRGKAARKRGVPEEYTIDRRDAKDLAAVDVGEMTMSEYLKNSKKRRPESWDRERFDRYLKDKK